MLLLDETRLKTHRMELTSEEAKLARLVGMGVRI